MIRSRLGHNPIFPSMCAIHEGHKVQLYTHCNRNTYDDYTLLRKEIGIAIAGTVSLVLMMNFPTVAMDAVGEVKKSLFWVVQFSNSALKLLGSFITRRLLLASD